MALYGLAGLEVRSIHHKSVHVLGWHRKGFRLFWTWKIRRGKLGRPSVPKQVRELIRTMSRENPIWVAPPEVRCHMLPDATDDLQLLAERLRLGLPLRGFDGRERRSE